MSRIRFIAAHPKRALGVLATCMVATGLTVGSGAYFSDESVSAGNTVEAGTVDIQRFGPKTSVVDAAQCALPDGFTNARSGTLCKDGALAEQANDTSPTFEVNHLVPNQPVMRCFSVKNLSNVPVALRMKLTAADTSNAALANALRVDIRHADQLLPNIAVGNKSFAQWASADPSAADGTTNDAAARRALEPQESYKYCATINLVEAGNQNSLMGSSVAFTVTTTAKSVYTSGV